MPPPNQLGRSDQQALVVTKIEGDSSRVAGDSVAREEALQLMVDGRPLAVMLRTPGCDVELTLGLLHAEGVVHRRADIAKLRLAPSGQEELDGIPLPVELDPKAENLVDVHLRTPLPEGALGWQRALPSSSACGICGTATLEALQAVQANVEGTFVWPVQELFHLPELLLEAQLVFHSTGGLHAAGLLQRRGLALDVAEDVGRHNAVDKLVGRALLRDQLPLTDALLIVSGRTGFEIVQKAAAAGIGLVASISAPSSLAVQTAEVTGVTLIGFLRGQRCNVYSHPERVGLGSGQLAAPH
ncbi:MAG TPA: formate dehydrogenase accessory sulfurtransferase FdhD [Candidatus Dormibacteraeota bacterium]|nr:formate dehydrogenase accessory sulfurtransferase FdhD [Candidatus Dormibacteraeota bacterium]